MQDFDVQGSQAIASLIEQSGLTKFAIFKTGAGKNSAPVFEFIKPTATNKQCKEAFLQWSNNILYGGNNSNVYELLLFNDIDIVEENENEVIQRSKKKSNKLRFSFMLSAPNERGLGVLNGAHGEDKQTTAELIRLSISNAMADRDKLELLQKVIALEKRFDEEEEELGESPNSKLLTTLGSFLLTKLGATTPAEKDVLNGVPDEKTENINRAIRILWKHDKTLDSDLLKLSALAENNSSQFNFLLQALRNL